MPEIMKAELELKKILTNAQETEEGVTQTETLVLSNSELDIRVKGGPSQFQKFVPGSRITISFSHSQTTLEDPVKPQEATEVERRNREILGELFKEDDTQVQEDIDNLKESDTEEETEEGDDKL
ncbi:MAG: hypothetical protein ACNYVW_09480 [Methanosarcinales archaeon]